MSQFQAAQFKTQTKNMENNSDYTGYGFYMINVVLHKIFRLIYVHM